MRSTLVYIILVYSCTYSAKKIDVPAENIPFGSQAKLPPQKDTCGLETKLLKAGLVDIQKVIPGILVKLKYSTTDNFMKTDMYGDMEHAYLQPDVAEKLKQAEIYLKEKDSSLTLIIYDAARPKSVQQKMWDTLKMATAEKIKFISNPATGSLHNFGAAVDISLAKNNGTPLDMGAPFDFIGELAYPKEEKKLLANGKLNIQQVNNRRLLREIMQNSGFFNIETEWWHFNACTREEALKKYKIIE